MKPQHIFVAGLMACMGLVSIAVPALSQGAEETVIVTDLRLITQKGKDEGVIDTQFIGEPEVERLLSLAKEKGAKVVVKMRDETHRTVTITTTDDATTNHILRAFEGTEMEGAFTSSFLADDQVLLGEPLLIELTVMKGGYTELFYGTLAANSGDWTGIYTPDYLVRIKPTLMKNKIRPSGKDSIRYDLEISNPTKDGYRVMARPRLLTELGKGGLFRNDASAQEGFSLKVKARKPG